MLTGTFGRVPISAHHSVVGSLVAVALITKGPSAVHWELVKEILFSWVGNPLLGMATSFAIFVLIDKAILRRDEPAFAFERAKWLLYLCSFQACLPFVLTKSPQIHVGGGTAVIVSVFLGLLHAAFSRHLLLWLHAAKARYSSLAALTDDQEDELDSEGAEAKLTPRGRDEKLREVEQHFGPLLILSALSVAFVHGAQDVSNAAGPLMQIAAQYMPQQGASGTATGAQLPWPLLLGVGAFVVGDLTLGSKVIVTVGSKITDMTPSRAFAAQMGTVVALTSATLLALPVSTSECIVGSVIGVGLAKKVCGYEDAGLNLRVLRKIWAAWLLTIPYAGTIAALFFYFVQLLCRLLA